MSFAYSETIVTVHHQTSTNEPNRRYPNRDHLLVVMCYEQITGVVRDNKKRALG